ncbi:MAG: hypothetical protein Q7U77_12930 [Sediminibacterium sp.]|jgi:hypothetical protein|uniref:hypothetical protein n=1 Tax=Sediminibacterium sp. TaxID=1917865 RepID=UPI0027276715|nr:hypothetical protein [Sediminibacterium sp.]MDO8997524.1 hypothetical protein [Sediminibacterium sp.]
MKAILSVFIALFFCNAVAAQYDQLLNNVYRSKRIFKNVAGQFEPFLYEKTTNGTKFAYGYLFNGKGINGLKYLQVKQSELNDTSCNYFEFFGKKIALRGKFINDFACDLDVSTFKIFTANFCSKKYLLITGVSSGSGSAGTTTVFNLFDVTDPKNFIHYPLWSKYGSELSFGDFNNDKVLDLMEIKLFSKRDIFKVELLSLDYKKSSFSSNLEQYKIFKYDGEKVVVLKSNKFKY